MEATRVILDFPAAGRNAPPLDLGTPRQVISASRLEEVRPALARAVRSAADGAVVAGFIAYEAAPAFDPAHVVRPHEGPAPLLWFGVFESQPAGPLAVAPPVPPRLEWHADTDRTRHAAAIDAIRAAIAAGDVYQVNHTLRFHAACDVEPATLFGALRAPGHGRYHALIETPEWAVISASPELFIDVRDGSVVTRPMKGTARRGRWLDEDRATARALAASPKDRAENLMIVDLLRNDLGRIAAFGSVSVNSMFDIETYPTVHQMTSTISARLRPETRIEDIFAAMFPCGSVTGAPKIAAMRQIARLEESPRGPYCGALGILRPDGSATFNVAIRTLLLDRRAGSAVYGSGSGITWDSAAAAEYDETAAKAALLLEALPEFDLVETLRLDDGVLRRLDLHLERLRSSCEYWRFADDACDNARHELLRTARGYPNGSWRVRLTVTPGGAASAHLTSLTTEDDLQPRAIALATAPVSSRDRLLFHKTTARATYEQHRAQQPDAFDVLLFNERSCITEFTIGNVVCDIAGELVTPPRTDGLLAGVFREQLLRAGVIRERSTSIEQALACRRMWLINSVREWVPVEAPAAVPR